jgi:phage terminase large subunit GpA-like protein
MICALCHIAMILIESAFDHFTWQCPHCGQIYVQQFNVQQPPQRGKR